MYFYSTTKEKYFVTETFDEHIKLNVQQIKVTNSI